MKTFRRTSVRRFGVASLLAATAAGMVTTTVAPREANAQVTTFATAAFWAGEQLMVQMFGYGFAFTMQSLFGPSEDSGLSAADLANIQQVVHDELVAMQLSQFQNDADTIFSLSRGYYRGTNVISAGDSELKALDIRARCHTTLENLDGHGVRGSATYTIIAAVLLSIDRELYELHRIEGYSSTDLESDLDVVSSDADAILNDFDTFRTTFNAQFSPVYFKQGGSHNCSDAYCPSGSSICDKCRNRYWCYLGPEGEVCSAYTVDKKKFNVSSWSYGSWNYNETNDARRKAEAEIGLQSDKIYYRNTQLGPRWERTVRETEKIMDGHFDYCGNQTCGIGEIVNCPADCTGEFAERGYFTTPGSLNLLESGDVRLIAYGGLVLYHPTTGKVIWYAGPSLANNVVNFSNGKLSIVNNNSTLWSTPTTTAQKMVILGNTLYLLDVKGVVVWSSDNDPTVRDTLPGAFCYSNAQPATILQNSLARVDWDSTGNLVMYRGASTKVWETNTDGTGKWLCMQEDGNLAIYSDQYEQLWKNGSGYDGLASLVGDQLRLTTANGEVVWATSTCSNDNCQRVTDSKVLDVTCLNFSEAVTLLENDDAKVRWESGRLTLTKKDAAQTQIWSAGGMPGGRLCFGLAGLVEIKGMSTGPGQSGPVYWSSGPPGSPGQNYSMVLAGCNLFINDQYGNTNFSTNTVCGD